MDSNLTKAREDDLESKEYGDCKAGVMCNHPLD